MTCVVAHRDGWMCADRRMVCTDGSLGPYVIDKIRRGPGLLMAAAGEVVLVERMARAITAFDSTQVALDRIQDLFLSKESGQDGHALILTADGTIHELLSRGALMRISSAITHWSIGSGCPFALGYLAAIERGRALTWNDAHAAIEFAATRTHDVGDGVQVEHLEAH